MRTTDETARYQRRRPASAPVLPSWQPATAPSPRRPEHPPPFP